MDILNFISWIKAKRLLKSAPQNSLLPIGVLDNRRGDKYQTYAIAPGDLGIGVITLDSYTELYDLLISESLVPGAKYRFPYRNVNFLNGWITADNNPTPIDPSFNPREIFVGDEEMLVVEAITESELSPTAHSESFSQDIIEYLPYANKIGVNLRIYNGDPLPNGSTVSGFDLAWDGANVYFNMPAGYPAYYGHYFYLYCEFDGGSYYQDGVYEPLTPNGFCQYPYTNDDPDYDYGKTMSRIRLDNGGNKVVLLDLTYQDYLNYDSNSLYIEHIQALGNAYGCITRRYDTENQINVPFDFRSKTYRRYEVDLTPINNELGIGYWGIGDNFKGQGTTGNYKDLLSIDWKGYEIYNIKVGAQGGMDTYWYNNSFDNNVFLGYAYDTTIEGSYSPNNTIGNGFGANTIGPYFSNNTIGLYFGNNTIDSNFYNNTIGNNFGSNTIDSYCRSNIIINDSFSYNTIGNSFQYNTIFSVINGSTIGDLFRLNNISKGLSIFSTNFTIGATFVYGDYNCNIFKRLDGTLQLSYVDGTNVVQYQPITG